MRVTVAGRVAVEAGTHSAGETGLGRLGRTALAYLVCERDRPVARDELADALWGEDLPASWEQLLRGLVAKVRATFASVGLDPAAAVTTMLGAYQVRLPPGAVVDIEEAAADLDGAAAALARGDVAEARDRAASAAAIASRQFLPAATGGWVERRQGELRELHLRALEVVSRAARAECRWGDAIQAAEEAIAIEPFRESAYLALMAAHAGAGSRGEALRAYERCRLVLAEELGVAPSPATEAAFVALLGDEPGDSTPDGVETIPLALKGATADFFVGRAPEVDRLEAALKRSTLEGRQSVFLAGEPGIGKTALVTSFAANAHAGGARVLYGRCDEELGMPYQPFAEALSHFVAHAPAAELSAHVARHGGELSRLVPELARRIPDAPPPALTGPELDRHRLFEAIGSLVAAAAEAVPLVLVLDDLHWAAPPTLSLLRHLLRFVTRSQVLVIGTYRHTDVGPEDPLAHVLADLRREPAVDRVTLRGLDEDDVAAFVRAAQTGPADDDGSLARALHAHTSGNPFFVGELLRHLRESGATYRRQGTWSYYSVAENLGIPEGVREVVSRRLHRLPEASRDALRWGAIVGAEFDLDLLEAVTGAGEGESLLDAVDVAVRAQLLVEEAPGRYAFAHALVRDTLHAEMTTTRRARRHRAVGEALESLPRDDVHRLPALAHHFSEAAGAGGAVKAADYAIAAARQAFAQSAWEDAIAFLERGLDALSVLDGDDLRRRCDLLLILAETWCRFWDVPRMRRAAGEALGVARTIGDPVRLGQATRWYLTSELGSDHAECSRLGHEALRQVRDDMPALRALILARMTPYAQNPEAVSGEALALARESGDGEALGVALSLRCKALAETPAAQERLALAEELVAAVPPGGWDGWRGGHEQRAIARLVVGDREGFEEDASASARLGTERRFWYYQQIGLLWRATLGLLDGRFHEVERLAAAANSPGDRKPAPGTPAPVSELYAIQMAKLGLEQGRPESAVEALRAALERVLRHPVLRAMLACARMDLGDSEGALRELHLSIETPRLVSATYAYLTEVACALGDAQLATVLYDRLRPFTGLAIAAGNAAHCPGSVDRYLAQLAITRAHWDDAEEHLRVALKVDTGLRSPPLVARTRYWYGRMLVDRGDPSDGGRAHEHLTASLTTAEPLGMAGLARQAQEVLERT